MSVTSDPAAPVNPPSGQDKNPPGRRVRLPPGSGVDIVLAVLLGLTTFFVHDTRYVLTAPFWNDENWVAISTRLPLGDLLRVTASSPPGWTMLLRFAHFGPPESLRIIPLLFAAAAVIAAFGFARCLPWPSTLLGRMAGCLAGIAVLMVPSALARNDLKQYTADAFVTIIVFAMVSRLDESWSRRRLIQLAGFVVVGFLFSAAGIFVGTAAFGSAILAAAMQREGARAREILVVGAVCAAALFAIYLTVYRPGAPPGLNDYWADFYVPLSSGWGRTWDFLVTAQHQLVKFVGLGSFFLALVLVVAGVTTLVVLRRVAAALLLPLLGILMLAASAARQYPLGDLRTSHFLATAIIIVAAIGVAGLCALAARINIAFAALVAFTMTLTFVASSPVRTAIRAHTIPHEDLKTPTAYVAAHTQPGDTIVLSMASSWGFGYYWPFGQPGIKHVSSNLVQFIALFPDQPNIVVADDRRPAAVDDVMNRAVAQAQEPGASGRIWLIHEHVTPVERSQYRVAASEHRLGSETVTPGVLFLLTLPSAT